MPNKIHGNKIAARLLAVAACSLAVAFVLTGVALAHGGAEITIAPTQAGPGDKLTIKGEGFEPGADVAVTLEGVIGVYQLAALKVADDGTFSGGATLPNVQAGSYQIKAAGGDDTTQLDFRVNPATTPTTGVTTPTTGQTLPTTIVPEENVGATQTTVPAAAPMSTPQSPQTPGPSSGALTYTRTSTDYIVAGVVLGLFVIGALLLLVRSPRTRSRPNDTSDAA